MHPQQSSPEIFFPPKAQNMQLRQYTANKTGKISPTIKLHQRPLLLIIMEKGLTTTFNNFQTYNTIMLWRSLRWIVNDSEKVKKKQKKRITGLSRLNGKHGKKKTKCTQVMIKTMNLSKFHQYNKRVKHKLRSLNLSYLYLYTQLSNSLSKKSNIKKRF